MLSLVDIQRIPTEKRSELYKVIAIEASKYLSLKAEADVATPELRLEQDDRQKLYNQLGSRIAALEENVSELRLKKSQPRFKDMGDHHPEALKVRTDQEFYAAQLAELVDQQQQLRTRIQSDSVRAKEKASSSVPVSPLALSKYDRELMRPL